MTILSQEEYIQRLLSLVQIKSGITAHTPKDFERLAQIIFLETRSNISVSTLKRLWGYLPNGKVNTRISTLNILARYVGDNSFEDFCHNMLHTIENPQQEIVDDILEQINTIRNYCNIIMGDLRILEEKYKFATQNKSTFI